MNIQKQMRVAHSASVIISLLINGALVIVLLFFIQLGGNTTTQISNVKVIEPTEKVEIEIPKEEIPPEVVETDHIRENDLVMDTQITTDFTPETEVVQPVADTNVNQLTELLSDIVSPVTIAGVMQGRTALSRQAALNRYSGGTGGVSEPAVLKALEWLRDRQKPDGSWDKEGNVAGGRGNAGYTGLALLTFLAHGETPSSAQFGPTVARAIRFLVENQDSKGIFQPSGSHTVYGHAIATYALAEAYTMTQNLLIKEPVERGARAIIEGMQPNGGFDYDFKPPPRNDSSLGAWCVQALKAVRISGVNVPNIDAHLQKAMDGIMANSQLKDNLRTFGYTSPGAGLNLRIVSAAGTLCMHLTGRGKTREGKQAMDNLTALYTSPETQPTWGVSQAAGSYGGDINLWYYAVQAFFHDDPGGRAFLTYYRPMVNALVKNQFPDGHWECFSDQGKGHGPVYNTTMAALALMVTYRHLPTTQAHNIQQQTPSSSPAPAADDGVVEVVI